MSADQLARLLDADWATARETGGLPRRLALELRHLIDGDLLAAGTRLPAERALARSFHVSRPTVTAALNELRGLGLVASRQGSGTWVTVRPPPTGRPVAMSEAVLAEGGINLAAATPADAAHLGDGALLRSTPAHGLGPEGLPELRAALAAWHTGHGLPTRAEDLIVTSGAHHALHLILGALCRPGDRVIVEQHTYGGLLDLLEVAHARPVPVPRDAHGIDPEKLERALRRTSPRITYLLPTLHAPTGRSTSPQRRAELAAVLDRSATIVVVDETLGELVAPVPSLAGLCTRADVVSVHSLSKTGWGGLRVGWIRARPALRARLLSHRARVDLGTSVPAQQAALPLALRLDAVAAERRTDLRAKAEHLRRRLAATLPEWEVPLPDGGLALWVRLPVADGAAFARLAEEEGVTVMPGAVARVDRARDPHVRLCHDRSPQILDEAVLRLARAWGRTPR